MNLNRCIPSLVLFLLISGCSGTYQAYYQTLKLGFSRDLDPVIQLEHVQNSAADLLEVKRGERAKAIMALAYIEAGQHKWVSGDQAMLIFEQGRIVRTIGFNVNLLHVTDKSSDPLKSFAKNHLQSAELHTWIRSVDWDSDEYGYQIVSSFSNGGEQELNILSASINTTLIVEELNYTAQANYIQTNDSWKNYYWFETTSGELIKSIQLLAPFEEQLEMVYLSRVARILATNDSSQVNL